MKFDLDLWQRVQRIVYPKRWPSANPPFGTDKGGPTWRPASWLYHRLAADPALRARVLP